MVAKAHRVSTMSVLRAHALSSVFIFPEETIHPFTVSARQWARHWLTKFISRLVKILIRRFLLSFPIQRKRLTTDFWTAYACSAGSRCVPKFWKHPKKESLPKSFWMGSSCVIGHAERRRCTKISRCGPSFLRKKAVPSWFRMSTTSHMIW